MKIIIKSNPKELRKIRFEIELYCKANFKNLDSSKVILAVDEALQNVMRYAYDMKPDQLIDIFFTVTLIIQIFTGYILFLRSFIDLYRPRRDL